jgi:hypothetical protein
MIVQHKYILPIPSIKAICDEMQYWRLRRDYLAIRLSLLTPAHLLVPEIVSVSGQQKTEAEASVF